MAAALPVAGAMTACSLIPDFGPGTSIGQGGSNLPGLQIERVIVSPVSDDRIQVAGAAGAATNGTVAVLFWVEPTPPPGTYRVQHRAPTIVEASASIAPDGGFAATVLESKVPGEMIRKGYMLEIVALGEGGRFGEFYSKALQ